MEYLLSGIFFFVALIYSSVGMGGGSSYTALMVIFGINYLIIPSVSLSLNLIVTSIGMVNFWRNGYGRLSLIVPFIVTSIPMSYCGGFLNLPKGIFQLILLIILIIVAVKIYLFEEFKFSFYLTGNKKLFFMFSLGSILGFIAGTIGIGGGVFLVPLIIMFNLGSEKEAAASGTVFIWVNSLAGVIARINTGIFDYYFIIPLIISVLLGGCIGSYLGSFKFKVLIIQKIMGMIIIVSIIFLFREIL
jgi:uncharacterized membrane protein YfcA